MNEIINESEFWRFMVINGPNKKNSKRNYISWLRFISNKYNIINQNLTKEKIENVTNDLTQNTENRNIYNGKNDISNIKSALNKYLKFINSGSNTESITSDLLKISNNEKNLSKKTEIETRLGQGKYRNELIELWEKCSITEFIKTDFLIASHIKPWRISENEEKVDKYNGLLLTPNFDKLFDKGYISFESDGSIILSKFLTKTEYNKLGIFSNSKLYKVFEENKKYLKFHKENIFME